MKNIKVSKKAIVISSVVIAITILLVIIVLSAGRNIGRTTIGYTQLNQNELVSSISVSGTVESIHTQYIYSALNYPVKDIFVSVGDAVKTGDILAELDAATLELDVAQQSSTLTNSQKTAAIDLEIKKRTYETARNQYDNNLNSDLINAENSLKTAEEDLKTKQTAYENDKALFDSGFISKQDFEHSETSYLLALSNYDKAVSTLSATKVKVEQDLKTAEANLRTAEANYNNESQRIALQKLEKNLADSIIKAPIDGTITAVYAVTGSPGSGLLFVIEDTENLRVIAYVKEYDASKVHPGQKVTIRSDATGDKYLSGEVVKISPASSKNAAGETISSSTVEFETEVVVLDHDPNLKIGMNARLNIILEKKDNVYAVPYDAVTINTEGEHVVYIISDDNGDSIIKEVVVETGIETDLYTEVSGSGLFDGIVVVNDTSSVKPGEVINLNTTNQ